MKLRVALAGLLAVWISATGTSCVGPTHRPPDGARVTPSTVPDDQPAAASQKDARQEATERVHANLVIKHGDGDYAMGFLALADRPAGGDSGGDGDLSEIVEPDASEPADGKDDARPTVRLLVRPEHYDRIVRILPPGAAAAASWKLHQVSNTWTRDEYRKFVAKNLGGGLTKPQQLRAAVGIERAMKSKFFNRATAAVGIVAGAIALFKLLKSEEPPPVAPKVSEPASKAIGERRSQGEK